MAFHIKNPDVERNLRRLADSYGVGSPRWWQAGGRGDQADGDAAAAGRALCPHQARYRACGLCPPPCRTAAEADPHFYKFAPGAVLADVLLGEDAGAYAAEIDAARETCTAPHAIQRASEILIDVAASRVKPRFTASRHWSSSQA